MGRLVDLFFSSDTQFGDRELVRGYLKSCLSKLLSLVLILSLDAIAIEINAVRLWRAPDHTRVVFDLNGYLEHDLLVLQNPDRIVLDLKNANLLADLATLDLDKTPIKRIRSGTRASGHLRIVLDLMEETHPRSFFLRANEKASDRLVLDLFDQVELSSKTKNNANNLTTRRDILIAIDAGHGGEDPGAIGPDGIQEKKIVLRISRLLNEFFNSERGFSPILIRNGDYYVSLKQRRQLARENKADAFISIHADAFSSSNVSGVSVYALSTRGASSTAANYLAQRENSADLVGGVSLADKDTLLASVLADLAMTSTLDASLNLGDRVLSYLGRSAKLHKKSIEQAGFAVLKSPDIPSILIETGFISNPEEARRLSSKAYQTKMAKNIFKGVISWFQEQPPPGTLLAWQREMKIKNYTIVRGDTLSSIALRFNVSIKLIKELNELTDNSIYAGKNLKIPTSSQK